jgi:DNA-binding YbaB/EbfC family protein
MNINQMMKQAAKMQEQVQKQAAAARAEGTAGGGAVTIVINGLKAVQSLKIDPEVVSKDDVEMLEEMIVAAFADAQKKVDEDLKKQMGGLLGGMGLPGF